MGFNKNNSKNNNIKNTNYNPNNTSNFNKPFNMGQRPRSYFQRQPGFNSSMMNNNMRPQRPNYQPRSTGMFSNSAFGRPSSSYRRNPGSVMRHQGIGLTRTTSFSTEFKNNNMNKQPGTGLVLYNPRARQQQQQRISAFQNRTAMYIVNKKDKEKQKKKANTIIITLAVALVILVIGFIIALKLLK
ncbi:hypothetical protein [Mycoplasma sp. Mirounga ES2805-ORL]|uniref:hypothetical protein n=1 Tax=Mycoplasma sp. Mirounga ES2805-ORL TaxID=754514 RepID=UPI00197B12FB|nr:hypothetical protein [Mycoplasma sp. Mirounga ES2805-ORL]QSF13524.1 hypothetical protein JXZ90_02505 [Mycoplasma sp. Mirounga ES2805-ORL]